MTAIRGTPTRQGPVTRRLVQLLSDGEWHPWGRVLTEGMKLIPPSVALRRNERDRQYSGGPPERVKQREVADRVAYGAKSVVRDALQNDSLFERRYDNGQRQPRAVRLRPPKPPALGERQLQTVRVLERLRREGVRHPVKAAGAELGVTPQTVTTVLGQLRRKLGVATNEEVVEELRRRQLL